jgi:hypothetical protein
MDTSRFARIAAGLALFVCFSATAQVNVLTYHNNLSRTGDNLEEKILTPSKVNANNFGKLFTYNVDGHIYAQPLLVSGVNIPGKGVRNVVFVATQHNSIYAFDADSNAGTSAGLFWQVNLGPSAATPNFDFGTRFGGYQEIRPEVGITGTPVIDSVSGTLYVDAFTHEGSAYLHRLHALNITNGNEQPFSPVVVNASIPGDGVGGSGGIVYFNPLQQLQRSALTLAGGILYINYAGYADTDPYHGWIIGFNPVTLQQLPNYIFNTTPNSTVAAFGANAGEGGIWMGGGGLAADANTNIYVAIGNGSFNAFNEAGGTEYGDSYIKFSTAAGLSVLDYFTPYNQDYLANNDIDVGSGGVALLPDQPGPYPHLMIGAGKGGTVYLMNRDMMTTGNNHYNSGGSVDFVLQTFSLTEGAFDTPAWFNGKIYYVATSDHLKAFSLTNGMFDIFPSSTGPRPFPYPGATPSVSADGTNNGIVWVVQNGTPAVLAAHNASDVTTEIYNSTQAAANRDQLTNGVKGVVPTVANGKVYVGGQNALSVFGLLGGALQFSAATYSVAENAGSIMITVTRTSGTKGAVQVNYATVSGGTAVDGVNYAGTSGTLNWADGDAAPKTFNVTILNDHLAGPNKTIQLALSGATGAAYVGLQSGAQVTIVESSYDNWKFIHFTANANNPAIAGNLADPDGDRIANILEYAFASDPNGSNTNSPIVGSLPANHLQLQFNRNVSATDLTFTAQSALTISGTWSNLLTFSPGIGWTTNTPGATVSESAPTGSPPDRRVTVTITDPFDVKAPGPASRFFRLRVQ